MLLLVHLIFGVLGVVREPHLPAHVADCLGADVVLCVCTWPSGQPQGDT
jgi:hypothetical protein